MISLYYHNVTKITSRRGNEANSLAIMAEDENGTAMEVVFFLKDDVSPSVTIPETLAQKDLAL